MLYEDLSHSGMANPSGFVDESPKLAQKFQVEGIPMLVFLQHGKTAGTSVGLIAKEDLILRLGSLLQTNA